MVTNPQRASKRPSLSVKACIENFRDIECVDVSILGSTGNEEGNTGSVQNLHQLSVNAGQTLSNELLVVVSA